MRLLLSDISETYPSSKRDIIIFTLNAQIPGEYFPEHDRRINAALDAGEICREMDFDPFFLCSAGVPDLDGLTTARYIKRQFLVKATKRDYKGIADRLIIGEQQSSHTAQNIRLSRHLILDRNFRLVILVSNIPHLWVAGAYFNYFIPEVPFVKYPSDWGRGANNLPYWRYLSREAIHYGFALTIDRWPFRGRFLDGRQTRLYGSRQGLRYPDIPE